jgi:Uma2 family endonuclease
MLTSTTNPPEDIADWELPPRPDVSHLITEDDTPVDNLFSEKQMRLLTESIHSSWQPGFPFFAMANVGVYVALNRPAIVPDVLVKTNVEIHQDPWEKDHRAYFAWTYDGKPPDVVIEIVSNTKGGELDAKLRNYQQIGVPWYAVYDPEQQLGERLLTVFSLSSSGRRIQEGDPVMFGGLGLGVKLWEGTYEGMTRLWLRWCDEDGNIILTGKENAAAESSRATAEAKRAAALAAKLRELGVDPESI